MKPKFSVLDAMPVVGKHTAENLSSILEESIDHFEIERSKCHLVVRDGGMKATTNAAGFDSLWCWAHVLNLVGNFINFHFKRLNLGSQRQY